MLPTLHHVSCLPRALRMGPVAAFQRGPRRSRRSFCARATIATDSSTKQVTQPSGSISQADRDAIALLRSLCSVSEDEDVINITADALSARCPYPVQLVTTSETYLDPEFDSDTLGTLMSSATESWEEEYDGMAALPDADAWEGDGGMSSDEEPETRPGPGGPASQLQLQGVPPEKVKEALAALTQAALDQASLSDCEDGMAIEPPTANSQRKGHSRGAASQQHYNGNNHSNVSGHSGSVTGSSTVTATASMSVTGSMDDKASVAYRKRKTVRSHVHKSNDVEAQWFVCDTMDATSHTRYVVVSIPPRALFTHKTTLVTFENYAWGAKVDRQLYYQAMALYRQLLPLLLDHIYAAQAEVNPEGRQCALCFAGEGEGGSLAVLLTLMLAARGIARLGRGLLPTYALDAPAPVAEVPHFFRYCQSAGGDEDGCSIWDADDEPPSGSVGLLTHLQLPAEAIKVVYTCPEDAAYDDRHTGLFKHIGERIVLTDA